MIEREIKELIKKNLPQHVGEALKERLEQADRDAKEVKALKAEKEVLENRIQQSHEKLEQYKQFDERNRLLDSREKDLETRENTQTINELKYQLESEKDKTQFSKSIALGLVRNTEYRKTIFDSELTPGTSYYDSNGTYHAIPPVGTTKNYTETETKE